MKSKLIVASRQSSLAIKQVEEVLGLFEGLKYELIALQSYGDKHKNISLLSRNVQPDFFTKEIDELLLEEKADIAIHSAKDLPYPLPNGLEIIALTSRADNSDSLVCRIAESFNKLEEFPLHSIVGTSSIKRKMELEKINPNLVLKSIRGTIEERIQQVDDGDFDAVIVATCALKRLGLESRISEVLPFQTHPLQGVLAVVAKKGRADLIEMFQKIDNRLFWGKAYLVGAGPGNPDLITVRGRRVLETADVIYYDDLIDKSVLSGLKNVEAIYVGKRKNMHAKEQDDINYLMVNSVFEGKNVVRLKGGDPMIFAHGGEEIEYLQSNLIDVEIIPGISTANAVASLCKIPLTHREIASSLAFVSGHALYGLQIPKVDSLVLYMAGTKIKDIAEMMIKQGWEANTPVALVHNVSMSDQKEFYYTLKQISEDEIQFPMPIIIIIGEVVNLKHKAIKQINFQKRVLVTGLSCEPYIHLGKIIHTPLIEIQPIDNNIELQSYILALSRYDNLLFTSRNTVYYFFEELRKLGKDSRSLHHLKIFSIGRITSIELMKFGIIPDYQAELEDSEGVLKLFRDNNICGCVLVPRSDLGLEIIPKGLRDFGLSVDTVIAYRNTIPEYPQKIDLALVDTVVFTSPSCVKNFMRIYGNLPITKEIVVRGVTTFNYLKSLDFPMHKINLFSSLSF